MAASQGSTTVDKAIDVLLAINAHGGAARPADIQRMSGHNKGTVGRLLNAWAARDFVTRSADGTFSLGPALVQLTVSYLDGGGVLAAARPVMQELLNQVRETVHLGRLEATKIVYLAKLESHQTIRMHSRVGALMPAHATALGKAILAYSGSDVLDRIAAAEMPALTATTITSPARLREELERTRARGYAIDEQENEEGVRCVAAPIFNARDVVAAVSVSAPSFRFSTADAEHCGPLLVQAARRISEALGGPDATTVGPTGGEAAALHA